MLSFSKRRKPIGYPNGGRNESRVVLPSASRNAVSPSCTRVARVGRPRRIQAGSQWQVAWRVQDRQEVVRQRSKVDRGNADRPELWQGDTMTSPSISRTSSCGVSNAHTRLVIAAHELRRKVHASLPWGMRLAHLL